MSNAPRARRPRVWIGLARLSDKWRDDPLDRQEEDIREIAEAEGWQEHPEGVLVERVSGSRYRPKYQTRDAWERMMVLAAAGEIDAVIVYAMDRLTREPRAIEDLIDLAETHGIVVRDTGGTIDLQTGDGKANARGQVTGAARESDAISRRVKRAAKAARKEGRPQWSFRPFGFHLDGTHHEAEASTLRDLYPRYNDGQSLGSLVRWLQDEGITQPERFDKATGESIAKPWTVARLSALLAADRNAGLYRSRLPDLHDEVTPAAWEAIVPAAVFTRAATKIAANKVGRSNRVAHLLSGLLVCDHCGGRLSVNTRPEGGDRYLCRKDRASAANGCGRSVSKAQADRLVTDAVLRVLVAAGGKGERITPAAPDTAALEAIIVEGAARQEELLAMTRNRKLGLTLDRITPELEEIAARVDEANAALASITAASPFAEFVRLPGLDGPERIGPEAVRAGWKALTLDAQRAIVQALLHPVVVRATAKVGRVFDESRIVIRYRDEAHEAAAA